MISNNKLKAVKHIVVHANCADGMTSAMILKDAIPQATVEFVQYGTEAYTKLVASEGMLFCDIAPPEARVQEFLAVEAIVLDHHKSTKQLCSAFIRVGLGAFGDETANPGVSGGVLAYEEVWLPLMGDRVTPHTNDIVKSLATLAGIRDTWQKQDSRWIQACEQAEALSFWPQEHVLSTPRDKWSDLLVIGHIVYNRKLDRAVKCAASSFQFVTDQKLTRVAAFEGMRASSDAAEILGDSVDLVIGFSMFLNEYKQLTMGFSCRSHTDFDCLAFAKAHGGGGHTKAAGFVLTLPQNAENPFMLAKNTLETYENKKNAKHRVILETPLSGDFARNTRYARLCMLDSLLKEEAPYASHLLYTQCLEDRKAEDRTLGIESGFAWKSAADYTVVYTDLGTSEGMRQGIELSKKLGQRIEYRILPVDLMRMLDQTQEFGTKL